MHNEYADSAGPGISGTIQSVKIMVGINDKDEIIPMGAWTAESWKVIGNAIYRANNLNRRLAPVKVANILVADGEIALGSGLKNLVHHKQRCQWYVPHDLAPLMKYQDGAATEDITHAMDKVSKIFEIEIPQKDFEQVSTEDLVTINQKNKECESEIKKLSELLSSKGYLSVECERRFVRRGNRKTIGFRG